MRIEDHLRKRLSAALRQLTGEECLAALGGSSTGSNISLHFGNRMLRQPPLTNPQLTTAQRLYEGRFGLFIECSWRLWDASTMIAASGDAMADAEQLGVAIDRVAGHQVASALLLGGPNCDLELNFDGDLRLNVVCTNSLDDNYSFLGEDRVLIVGPGGRLRQEAP